MTKALKIKAPRAMLISQSLKGTPLMGKSKKRRGPTRGIRKKREKAEVKKNEAMRKVEIKAGKRPMISNDQEQCDSMSNNHNCNLNRASTRAENYKEANETWEIGKKLGMVFDQNEKAIIDKLVEMEERDRARCLEANADGNTVEVIAGS